ncbi:hypothetical protein C0T31_07830 [Dysgonamonadaceae bacterium]|nr:hypothetical protein C0T31_07830 [Dysgonamonadaceae bacterium]
MILTYFGIGIKGRDTKNDTKIFKRKVELKQGKMKELFIRLLKLHFVEGTKHNEIWQNDECTLVWNITHRTAKIKKNTNNLKTKRL